MRTSDKQHPRIGTRTAMYGVTQCRAWGRHEGKLVLFGSDALKLGNECIVPNAGRGGS